MIRLLTITRYEKPGLKEPREHLYRWDFKKGFLHTEMDGFTTPIDAIKRAIKHLGKHDEVITELEVEE